MGVTLDDVESRFMMYIYIHLYVFNNVPLYECYSLNHEFYLHTSRSLYLYLYIYISVGAIDSILELYEYSTEEVSIPSLSARSSSRGRSTGSGGSSSVTKLEK